MRCTQNELKSTASRTEAGRNMELVKYPDEILTTPSYDVLLTPQVLKFIEEMESFFITGLKWGIPAGLAAPQVGKNWNIFIALGQVYINPQIVKKSHGGKTAQEGCYSLEEGKYFDVWRNDSLHLKWIDKDGVKHKEYFHDFYARVIQHEFDHLQGILCNHKKS